MKKHASLGEDCRVRELAGLENPDVHACSAVLPSSARRRLLTVMGVCAGGIVVLPASQVFARGKGVKLSLALEALRPLRRVGGSVVADIPSHGLRVLLVREAESTIRALQPLCSHEKNALVYDAKARVLRCTEQGKSHDSNFSLQGKALSGAALRLEAKKRRGNLRTYPTKVVKRDGQTFVLIKLGA